MRIHLASASVKAINAYHNHRRVNKLLSFLHERNLVDRFPACRMILDSGGYSYNNRDMRHMGEGREVATDLPDPKLLLRQLTDYAIAAQTASDLYVVELDIYATLTKVEIDRAAEEVTSRLPRSRFIRVYHPMLDGGTFETLDRWQREGYTYVGVGNDSMPMLGRLFNRYRTSLRIHGFALTGLEAVRTYPFYSVDSTSWKSTHRYGRVIDPVRQRVFQTRKKAYAAGSAVALVKGGHDLIKDATDYFLNLERETTDLWARRGVRWDD